LAKRKKNRNQKRSNGFKVVSSISFAGYDADQIKGFIKKRGWKLI
jgi:hypothetical protein